MLKQKVIFFVKTPQRGNVKTRLAAGISQEKALNIYVLLLKHSWRVLKNTGIDILVAYTPPGYLHLMKKMFGAECDYLLQKGNDMGSRMANAFQQVFDNGTEQSLLTGSDLPGLDEETIIAAFEALADHDVVLGPSGDGGYYLIGIQQKSFSKAIFKEIAWGSSRVHDQTVSLIKERNLSLFVLPIKNDIDTLSDLEAYIDNNENTPLKDSIRYALEGESL
jgi:uncharacterized protein